MKKLLTSGCCQNRGFPKSGFDCITCVLHPLVFALADAIFCTDLAAQPCSLSYYSYSAILSKQVKAVQNGPNLSNIVSFVLLDLFIGLPYWCYKEILSNLVQDSYSKLPNKRGATNNFFWSIFPSPRPY